MRFREKQKKEYTWANKANMKNETVALPQLKLMPEYYGKLNKVGTQWSETQKKRLQNHFL